MSTPQAIGPVGSYMAVSVTDLERIFPGHSEMAQRMRAHDWAATPVGPPESWPPALRTALSICIASRFPMQVWWGPDLTCLYNDGYIPLLGNRKHPRVLGRSGREAWPEIWSTIGPMVEGALEQGTASWSEDILMFFDRELPQEEVYVTFSFSPIYGEADSPEGVYCACTETTEKLVGHRRLAILSKLAIDATKAQSAVEACDAAAEILAENPHDMPFAAIYLSDTTGSMPRLVASAGFRPDACPLPESVEAGKGDSWWPLAEALETMRSVEVDLEHAGVHLPGGPWPEPSQKAIIVPIMATAPEPLTGLLVAGISPRRPWNTAYRNYPDLVARHLGSAVARAKAYEEERKRVEALAQLDQSKTAFFSNVSHEFRTPLTLILGPLEDLLSRKTLAQEEQAELLTVAHRNVVRLQKLVNMLLEFSGIQASRVRAVYRPTDLAALTTDLASNFRSVIEKAGLSLHVNCPALPQPVYVDRDMWERIVLNLLSNAFKFTFEGSIQVSLRAVSNTVEMSVSDTGTGIAEQELTRIFERFHRIEGARGRTFEGTGIGLALVHDLVGLHGGKISVESQLGKGSIFTVTVSLGKAHLPEEQIDDSVSLLSPSVHSDEFAQEAMQWLMEDASTAYVPGGLQDGAAAAASDRGRDEAGPGQRVLLADDNADMRQYVRRILGRRYIVTAVNNGVEALDRALREPPDLVLADVMMPRMDGFELLRNLRARRETSSLPVILLTARAGQESRIAGLEYGADDYLVKPFSALELQARVKTHLALAQLRKQAEEHLRVEKETLLKEVNHRVKNNLQVIDSLLRLQADAFPDARVRAVVRDTARRVQIIAEIHRLLYGSADLANVDIKKFIAHLCSDLSSMFTVGPCRAQMLIDVEPIHLDLQRAVPLGLIFNELISNALKHAFPPGGTGAIRIQLHQDGDSILMRVSDNGVGFPERLPKASLGLQLVRVLTEQMRGVVQFDSSRGVRVSIRFPSDRLCPSQSLSPISRS